MSKKTLINIADSFANLNRFSNDVNLKRYRAESLKYYVSHCCDDRYLIEAYSLGIQYVHNLMLACGSDSAETNDTEASIIIKTLKTIGIIPEKIYKNYERIKNIRKNLEHDLIKNPKVIDSLSKVSTAAHKKNLISIINDYEDVYIDIISMKKIDFTNLTKVTTRRMEILINIVSNRVLDQRFEELYNSKKKKETFGSITDEINQKIANILH